MITFLIIFGLIVFVSFLAIAYILYVMFRVEGERDWLMRVTNKKGIAD